MTEAKTRRDVIRSLIVESIKAGSNDFTALLAADALATRELAEALAGFPPVGAVINGSFDVELDGSAQAPEQRPS